MSNARPLRLKSQEFRAKDDQVALSDPVVNLWVDNAVAHLDGVYSYIVPERLSGIVIVGIRVSVSFNGREVEALVIERSSTGSTSGLKYLSSVLSAQLVAPEKLIELISKVSQRWICHPYDVIRSAIPPKSAAGEREFLSQLPSPLLPPAAAKEVKRKEISRSFIHIQPMDDAIKNVADLARQKATLGSVLIIVPEERDLQRLHIQLEDEAIMISSSSARSERYRSYLKGLQSSKKIVIGTRSAIFTFPSDLSTLIVFKENSQSHYEPRTPGWNVRDVALLRSELEMLDLIFVGYSPSAEAALMIANDEMKFLSKKSRLKVINLESSAGQLLPERIFPHIRKALKSGPVLFLVPRKGYASSLVCKKCRNIATCKCGGRLARSTKSLVAGCVHCSKLFPSYKCAWCQSDQMALTGRGGERHAEEIGRAFPNFPVVYSTADNPITEISVSPSLVISTAGMEPRIENGYAAVVLLEGDSFFSFADLRAQERAREAFFEAASLCSASGEVISVVNSSNPITSALTRWSPLQIVDRELDERKEVSLPPHTRAILIDIPTSEANGIAEGFRKSVIDMRLPGSTLVLGPAERSGNLSRIIITCAVGESEGLLEFMHQFLRHRAVSKKANLFFRVDPYSLS